VILILSELKSSWSTLLIALPTIDRSTTVRFEWNFCFFSTICTCNFMHFSFVSIRHLLYFSLLRPHLMGSNGILFRCYLYMRIVQVLAGTRSLRLHPAAILISHPHPWCWNYTCFFLPAGKTRHSTYITERRCTIVPA